MRISTVHKGSWASLRKLHTDSDLDGEWGWGGGVGPRLIGGLEMDRKPHFLMRVCGIAPFKPNFLAILVFCHRNIMQLFNWSTLPVQSSSCRNLSYRSIMWFSLNIRTIHLHLLKNSVNSELQIRNLIWTRFTCSLNAAIEVWNLSSGFHKRNIYAADFSLSHGRFRLELDDHMRWGKIRDQIETSPFAQSRIPQVSFLTK